MTDAPVIQAPAAAAEAADDKRRRQAWILFAGGLESFNVPILYVLFAPYFTSRVAPDPVQGQVMWANTVGIAGLFAALLSPPLAFVAEHPGRRRSLMIAALVLGALPAVVFWLAAPGSPPAILAAVLFAYGVAATANDLLYVFYGAMLPEVARPAIMGRTAGLGAAVGWAIALAATALYLLAFVWPETPLLGFDKETGEPARLAGPFAAVLMLAFCAPLLLFPAPEPPVRKRMGLKNALERELTSLLRERAAAIVVVARLVYWSGVVLVMSFGNVVATGIMGWTGGETGSSAFGVVVLVTGAVGAYFGGVVDDRLGTRNALCLTLVGLGVSLSVMLTMSPDRLFGLFPVPPRAPGDAELTSVAELVLLALGAVTGAFLGAVGPMGRSLVARYSPPGRTGRYYGLSALAGNATNVVGPFFVGLVTGWTGSQRLGLLVAPALLVLGVAVLLRLPKQGYRTE